MNFLTRNLLTKTSSFSYSQHFNQLKLFSSSITSVGTIGDTIDTITNLTSSQIELRHSVRKFIENELPQNLVQQIDKEDNFDGFRDLWKNLGRMGFHGVTVPAEYNGLDLGYLEHCIVMEEISRVCGAIALSYGAHSNLCINQLKLNGSKEQKDKYLNKLVSGDFIGALAMSETTAGSDVTSMKISAKKDGKHYILNGQKFWITNGGVADLIFVYAKTGENQITAFLVEKDFEGFSVGQKISKMGMRGSPTNELIFDNCRVPEENIVGGLGNGVYVLMSGLDYERLVLSAGPLGLMQMACEQAFDYCHNRKQFSSEIAKFQLVQGKMADMFVKLNVCRSYVYSVAKAIDESKRQKNKNALRKGTSNFTKDCAGVILFCAEQATQSCLDAIQLLGGNGYTNEYIVGRLLRDAKLYEIGAGTSEIRRWLIGREINKNYFGK